MGDNLAISSPDFGRILQGNARATHDAVRLLWLALNSEVQKRRRDRLLWQAVAYDAARFGATAGTWTVASGDQALFKYLFTGNLMLVQFSLVDTTTGAGMGTGLTIQVPLNLSAAAGGAVGMLAAAGNIDEIGVLSTQDGANANTLLVERADGSSWPSGVSNDLDLQGFIAFEIG